MWEELEREYGEEVIAYWVNWLTTGERRARGRRALRALRTCVTERGVHETRVGTPKKAVREDNPYMAALARQRELP